MAKRLLFITGTPATGKSTLAEKLVKEYGNASLYNLNALVLKHKLFLGKDSEDGAVIANIRKLKTLVKDIFRKDKADLVIIEGHLLCELKMKVYTLVLREHLPIILKRLKKRKYSTSKIRDNVVSEALDYCGITADNNGQNVHELISSEIRSARKLMLQIERGRLKNEKISLANEFVTLMKSKSNRKYAI